MKIFGTMHFITRANKNSTEALSLAMEICSKERYPEGVPELVGVINNAAIALRRLCESAATRAENKRNAT